MTELLLNSNSKENDQQLSGLELDELDVSSILEDELDVSSIPEEENSKGIERKNIGKKRVALFFVLGLSLLAGMGYLYIKVFWVNRLQVENNKLLVFDSFVIPVKENKKYTYVSFSISFKLPNKKLEREMIEKKDQLRGIIYDVLIEEINRVKDFPSLERLNKFIIREVNGTLSAGKIIEASVKDFLAV